MFTIAGIKRSHRIEFEDADGGAYAHDMRGVGSTEYSRLVEEGQRLLVTTQSEGTPEEKAEGLAALNDWFLCSWTKLVLGVDGYPELSDASGDRAAVIAYFSGETLPEGVDERDVDLVKDHLLAHVKQAVQGWMAANEVPSFRPPATQEGHSVGASG